MALEDQDLNRFENQDTKEAKQHFMEVRKEAMKENQEIPSRGGSDGCVNFDDPDNAGLARCIITTKIEQAYQQHCDVVSLADFIVIAAEAVMGRTATGYNKDDAFATGSLLRDFRDQFKHGRETVEKCPWNHDLMPNAEKGCKHVNDFFISHIFKNTGWADYMEFTPAIQGAHTLGQAKSGDSGYSGAWTSAESYGKFNNDYYKTMLARGWGPELAVGGNPKKNQWRLIDQGKESDHKEMMLNSDLCLAYQNNPVHAACMEKYKDESNKNTICKNMQKLGRAVDATAGECCAWTHKGPLFNHGVFDLQKGAEVCGVFISETENNGGKVSGFDALRDACCGKEGSDSIGDCDSSAWPKGQFFT